MKGDYLPRDVETLWKELSTNPVRISPEQLRKEAEKLRKGLRRRSILGGGATCIVIAGFAVYFFIFPNWLQRVGSILTILGALYMVVQLRMKAERRMPDVGETDSIRFYRTELERQRDFHRGSWFWSRLLIFLPGPIIFCIGFAQAHPRLARGIWLEVVALLILAVIAVPLNLRLARKYQLRIDALDTSLKSPE